MRWIAGGAAFLVPLMLGWAAASAAGTGGRVALLPLSMGQVTAAGAAGTGCSWSSTADRRTRFAAADDRAVVRLPTGVVRLRPAAGAVDLFPFTYDRWVGAKVTAWVRPLGRAARKGGDAVERTAILAVTAGSATLVRRGTLNCGS